MIALKLQIVLIASSFVFLVIIINLIRKESLELKYSIIWLISALLFLLLPCFPFVLTFVTKVFGIASPMNALFLLGTVFLIAIVFSLTVALSRNADRLKRLTQELVLLKVQLEEIKTLYKEIHNR